MYGPVKQQLAGELAEIRKAGLYKSERVITTAQGAHVGVGGATVLLRQTVRGPHGVCATLRIKLACVRIGGSKPARIPPRWRDALNSLRHENDAGGRDA